MPKRNIYFTDEQAALMKLHDKENWSAVCQEAVDARMRYLTLRSNEASTAVDRARIRLANAKAAYVADASERGERAGMEWAADDASFDQLRRLNDAMQSEYLAIDFDDTDTPAEYFPIMIGRIADGVDLMFEHGLTSQSLDEEDIDRAHALWSSAGIKGDNDPDSSSREFWKAFVNGALRVFEQL